MIHENEVITLAIGIGVYIFVVVYRTQIERIPDWKTVLMAYRIFLVAWALTVLEGFFWESALNALEHLCYVFGMILIVVWIWKTTRIRKESGS
jgi:membrane protein CcdC involved in cytochrome C biogenesis